MIPFSSNVRTWKSSFLRFPTINYFTSVYSAFRELEESVEANSSQGWLQQFINSEDHANSLQSYFKMIDESIAAFHVSYRQSRPNLI
jgi:hypothetical protein